MTTSVGKLLSTALGLIALGVLAVSCAPANRPSRPTGEPTPAEANARQEERLEKERQLQALSADAEDLFNRGENDLACDRVRQAQELQTELGIAPSDQGLEQAQACISDVP